MLKMPITPREILRFPRQGLGWEATADQWHDIVFCKSHRCRKVRGLVTIGSPTDCVRVNKKTGCLGNQ